MMLSRSLRYELFKLFSRRTTLVTLMLLALSAPLFAFGIVLILSGQETFAAGIINSVIQDPSDLVVLTFQSTNLLCGLLGILVIGSEFNSGAILRTYQNFSSRVEVLAAKALSLSALVAVASAIGSFAALSIFTISEFDSVVIASPVSFVIWCTVNNVILVLFAYGVALIFSRTISSLIAVFSVFYILPDVLRTLLGFVAPDFVFVSQLMPAQALGAGIRESVTGNLCSAYVVSPVTGLFVTLVLTFAFVLTGCIIQGRKDV